MRQSISTHVVGRLLLLAALVTGLLFSAGSLPAHAQPARQASYYTVQPGDTWAGIAASFGVPVRLIWQANGVTNPAALAAGHELFIPAHRSGSQPVIAYDITSAIVTWRAALESGNLISSLLLVNGVSSPASVVGQRITMPARQDQIRAIAEQSAATVTPAPTSAPTQPPTPAPPPTVTQFPTAALDRELVGVQGFFMFNDGVLRAHSLDMVAYDLGAGWIKQQVVWKDFEYEKDRYSKEMWHVLDEVVNLAKDRGLKVLLSIHTAPDWARATQEEEGPPVDFAEYSEFVKDVVLRYKGKVHAVEIWNEPNLRREWNGAPLNGAEYVRLLAGANEIIKRTYPEGNVIVVSAGLAPTGVTSDIAVDDRLYLRQMYEAGLAQHADAIGIHPYSWGNPPWTRCCGDWGGAPTHNDHPSFFFLDTIEDYREIQAEFGDLGRPLWATEFGWGTMDKLGRETPADAPFFNYVNENLQAQYILEAYRMAQEWDFMGPMFLWNFNIAAIPGFDNSHSGYSILRANNDPRPAYEALRAALRTDM
ncbi:MAG: LysM peptidoglycan-binding domain-containing protein [Chloroflexi bacterium]|nr:LysM peptidoglycan-binding domain-containing protein [Chloroflexota bacterium]